MYKLGLEKAEEPEIKLSTFMGSQRKQKNSRKPSISALSNIIKPLAVQITANYGKFLKKWGYQTNLPVYQETCMQIKKKQVETDMEQWTGSKLGKEYKMAIF